MINYLVMCSLTPPTGQGLRGRLRSWGTIIGENTFPGSAALWGEELHYLLRIWIAKNGKGPRNLVRHFCSVGCRKNYPPWKNHETSGWAFLLRVVYNPTTPIE